MSRTRLLGTGAILVVWVFAAFAAAGPASAREVLRVKPSLRAASASVAPPVTWCGSGPSPVDRQPSVEISSPDQIHVVYAVPSDRPDRFATLAIVVDQVTPFSTGWPSAPLVSDGQGRMPDRFLPRRRLPERPHSFPD